MTDPLLVVDPTNPRRWRLDVGGVPQSYVDLDDPTRLVFGYMQAIGAVLGAVHGLRFVHVGGGAMTMVRYLAATRPGSTHVVLEPDADQTEQVLTSMPLPANALVDVRALDGVTGVAALQPESVDVVIVDAHVGDAVPTELVERDFLDSVARALTPGGVVVGNVPRDLTTQATVPSAVSAGFGHWVSLAPAGVRRTGPGNLVYAASDAPLLISAIVQAAGVLDPPQQVESSA